MKQLYNIKSNITLPPIETWMNPNVETWKKFVPSEYDVMEKNQSSWREDYPDYDYFWQNLQELKLNINSKKAMYDTIPDLKPLQIIDKFYCSLHDLKGKAGIIAREYNGEIVSNAWLKIYEICECLKKDIKKKTQRVVHYAEAPGNFILGMNHWMTTHNKIYDWYASSYVAGNNEEAKYFSDNYGIIRKFKNRWFYGADMNGDITSTNNIRDFDNFTDNFGKADIMTSDVKYVPLIENYDEEENINIPVHVGHLLCALVSLKVGGIAVLKEFEYFEASSICLLMVFVSQFKQCMIFKPQSSGKTNSEVYLIGIGYKKNLNEEQMNLLYNYMDYIRPLNNEFGSPALFPKDQVPESFVDEIYEIQEQLVSNQSQYIDDLFNFYYENIDANYNEIKVKTSIGRRKLANDWIKKNDLRILQRKNKLL